jgi:3',5'-cyclic AMP phosphodiesterase CpdA
VDANGLSARGNTCLPGRGAGMTAFRVVQVADLHLSAAHDYHYDNWERVVAWINRERPDLVVANGDLVLEDPDSEDDHAFARSALAKIAVPLHCLPGNHDIGDAVLFGKMEKRMDDRRRARFVRHFGEERWSFEAGGWGFVGINAMLFGSGGQAAEAEQWAWIEERLRAHTGRPVALFTHKPLFLDHPSDADHEDLTLRQSCIDRESRARLIALCRRHGVRLVSSGHKHQTRAFSLDGIYHIWAPSTACVNGRPDSLHWGVREVGFVDYRFTPGGFTHRIVCADFLFRHENYIRRAGAAAG